MLQICDNIRLSRKPMIKSGSRHHSLINLCPCSSDGLEQQPSKLWVARSIRARDVDFYSVLLWWVAEFLGKALR